MARYNIEAARERNRRKSADFNDPLRFVREVGGLSLKESAVQQLKVAEKNRMVRAKSIDVAQRVDLDQDHDEELIMQKVTQWTERRRSSLTGDVSISGHSFLEFTRSNPRDSGIESPVNESIPEDEETSVSSSPPAKLPQPRLERRASSYVTPTQPDAVASRSQQQHNPSKKWEVERKPKSIVRTDDIPKRQYHHHYRNSSNGIVVAPRLKRSVIINSEDDNDKRVMYF